MRVPIRASALVGRKIWDHQKKAIRRGARKPFFALLMEQGTGKTLVAIALAGLRHIRGEVDRVLILTHKSTLYGWEEQITALLTVDHRVEVLDGRAESRAAIVKEHTTRDGKLDILITNYHSASNNIIGKDLKRWKPDMVIVDESHNIKSYKGVLSKTIWRIGKKAGYRLIMTGTPIVKNPLDIFGQYRFLDDRIFGTVFKDFKAEYCKMGGYMGYEIKGWLNQKKMARKINSIAFRITKEECLDLPEEVFETLHVLLEPEAQAIYDEMEKEAIVTIEEQDIIAPIVLTKLLRLSQITGGYLGTPDGPRGVSGAKYGLLQDTLMDIYSVKRKKVVVFARFLPEVKAIFELGRELGFHPVVMVGKTDPKTRYKRINRFHEDPNCRMFVAQIATGGVGIDLTPADTAIFYSTDYSFGNYEQAKARLHRPGQENKVTYLHIIAKGTIDEIIHEAIVEKRDVARYVIDTLRGLR